MNLVQTAKDGISKVRTYWKTPMAGRYMTFREIAAYSGGGIGAYFLITLGTACILGASNVLLTSTLGVDATDMYIMYVIAVLANIPLTGIRANIIDNTRNKAGKYRPYIVTMAIPTAIICILMVWFPYNKLESIVGVGTLFGESYAYIAKCAVIMVLNLFLHFFYYFFYDAYENLIHVLSPNSQERADVSSVKSVVYSFAPSLVNLITPIIAQNVFHTNTTDIRVYRLLYPILGVLGILLCIVVYKYTEEKIVQARTHVVQIKFMDALRAVAKNKYFWIISLATWVGFLETAYGNVLAWLYNYGGVCNGNVYGLVVTIYGNSALWSMLLAPFVIRRWGKKAVLVVTNFFNIIFLLMMLPFTAQLNSTTIWLVMLALWLNSFMTSFGYILNPAIQADIRDYQQYRTGERIDGAFSTVSTIGTIVGLVTSSVLPVIYQRSGITKENAAVITSNPDILNRMLGDGKTVGQILSEQLAAGQDNYTNAFSALYDPELLIRILHVLIIFSALGALMNVVPYFWYDFNERKQKSVVSVLKVRAMFEDYGNGMLPDGELVETVDLIRDARVKAAMPIKEVSKKDYKGIKDKDARKQAKKDYRAALNLNEEIEIARFVCDEMDKFSTDVYKAELKNCRAIYDAGLSALYTADMDAIRADLRAARALPKDTPQAKALREFSIEMARNRINSRKTISKHFKDIETFRQPDFAVLEGYFNEEDACDEKLKKLYAELNVAKKSGDRQKVKALRQEIDALQIPRKQARLNAKKEMDMHAYFNRAAKPYLDAKKLIDQAENYSHFDEIASSYEEAKARYLQAQAQAEEEAARLRAEEEALTAKLKAEKAAQKNAKKRK